MGRGTLLLCHALSAMCLVMVGAIGVEGVRQHEWLTAVIGAAAFVTITVMWINEIRRYREERDQHGDG